MIHVSCYCAGLTKVINMTCISAMGFCIYCSSV